MSVIIRLQNLPWSANALDIRTFFRGLAIPDGGVHIVGGEMGDAFIAFSTDEDARQAMLLDRGKINEVQIRLLLSSRAEMQKVIETARQTSLSMMQLAQKQKQSKPQQQQLQKPNQQQQKPIQSTPIPPQPPVITSASINNILSQPAQHSFGPNENSVQSYQSYNQFNENSVDSRDSRDKFEEHGRSGRDRSHDRDRGRQRNRSRSRSRSRDRRRSRSRDRSGSRRRKDRSVSRDRRDRHRNSRSRDRSRSRENENKNRRDRDTRDPRDQRDKGLYDHRDPRDSRDPRERLLKGRADNSDTTNIPMVIVDDDEEKDETFSQQKKNVNIWDVPPPTTVPPNNYNQQGFKLFGQSQVPSYQSSENKMNPYNPMRNQYIDQHKHTGMQQSQPPMVTQQNKFPLQQQPHYQSLAQNFSTLQNQQYEAFKNAIRTPSVNQGLNQQSSEKMQQDKTNSQTTAGNESKDNPILNFQSLVSSNLMSSLNYFGSNSKSTPFTNPYTLASKTCKDGSPVAKEENNATSGKSTTSFSGLFGNNSNKDEYTPRNLNEGVANANQAKGSEISSPKDPFIQRGGSDVNKSPQALDPKEINYDEIKGNCIKISNMCPSTSYSDLRRFFSGLYIANNGIKMINDKHGLRIGVAYVHFVRPESKPKAFIRNGLALKSKKVIIESCTEEEFDEVVDSYKPARKPSRFEQAEERNSLNKKDDSDKTSEDGPEKAIEETPFTALLLEDVPPFATEQNIIKMFSSYTLIDIILTKDEESRKQLIGYVKFHRADDAKKALEEKSSHLIGHKQVFVSRCSDEDFDKAKEKQNMPPEMPVEEEEEEEEPEQPEEPKDQENVFNPFKNSTENKPPASNNNSTSTQNFDETQQSMSNLSEMDSQIPSLLTLPPVPSDPRRRGGRQGSRFNRPEENTNRQGSTPFVLIKNCDYKSTKYDFADIFLNMGITPNRIEILYNNRHLPSGECIVEFACAEDAEKALARNNSKCGNRMVRIELVPPSFVADRLGENFLNQGNNRPDAYQQNMPPFNGNNAEMNRNFGPNMNMNNMNMNMGMGGPFNSNMNNMNMNSMGGMNNMPDNNMMGNPSAFRPGGNNVNPNRRGPKKSRFSDYNENPRSFGSNQSNNGNNMPTIMPPNMNMHQNMSQNMPPNMPQPLNNTSVDQFGQPDCVVGMENVPYKAGIEDILEFFRKFNVQPRNVIRRYNDDGTPTGDARVAFSSPMEARAAIESKRNQKIFNRTIFLSIV